MSALALASIVAYLTAAIVLAQRMRSRATADAAARRSLPALIVAWIAALLHLAHVFRLHAMDGGVQLGFFAALSLVALAMVVITLVATWRRAIDPVGLAVFPIAALAVALDWALGRGSGADATIAWQIHLHAWLALLAYAALSFATLLAIMLWVQERALREHRMAALLHWFPPLTMVETLMFRLIFAGFALLTLALATGAMFVENLFEQHLMHKTVLSFLAWLVFGGLLIGRSRYGWRGRRAVRWSLSAMALLGLAFFGSKFVLELVLQRGA